MIEDLQYPTIENHAAQLSDERQLVCRLVAGDGNAWIEFVDRFQRVIAARVRLVLSQCSIMQQAHCCDDLVADLFAALLADNKRLLKTFEHRSTLATWLTIIAHRMTLKAVSKINSRRELAGELESRRDGQLSQMESHSVENPLAQLLSQESRSEMHQKLALLKPVDRQVIELFHFENLDYREIASRLGMSVNSVGPKLTRAQRRLKQILEDAV